MLRAKRGLRASPWLPDLVLQDGNFLGSLEIQDEIVQKRVLAEAPALLSDVLRPQQAAEI